MRERLVIAGLLVSILAVSVFAHETWMMPSAFSAKVGEEVRLDATSGMSFPRLESPILADRVAKAAYRLGQDVFEVTGLKNAETSLVLRQSFAKAGIATIWLDLKPKEIELTDEEVAEYLDEIHATEKVRSIWAGQKGRVAWRESYTKHLKTFVAVGDAMKDASWSVSTGAALEIVPKTNPCSFEVGQDFTVELQTESKPLPGLPVGLFMGGAKDRVFRTTNANGRATFPVAAEGRAMLFTVRLQPAKDGKSWMSDFCTMTFEIRKKK
jgi:uncharacterized GH25 family protein